MLDIPALDFILLYFVHEETDEQWDLNYDLLKSLVLTKDSEENVGNNVTTEEGGTIHHGRLEHMDEDGLMFDLVRESLDGQGKFRIQFV